MALGDGQGQYYHFTSASSTKVVLVKETEQRGSCLRALEVRRTIRSITSSQQCGAICRDEFPEGAGSL